MTSLTLLPYAGMITRSLHPQFSKLVNPSQNGYIIAVRTWATHDAISVLYANFFASRPHGLVGVPCSLTSCYTCHLQGYCSLSRLLPHAHGLLPLRAILQAPRLALSLPSSAMKVTPHRKDSLGKYPYQKIPEHTSRLGTGCLTGSSPR